MLRFACVSGGVHAHALRVCVCVMPTSTPAGAGSALESPVPSWLYINEYIGRM